MMTHTSRQPKQPTHQPSCSRLAGQVLIARWRRFGMLLTLAIGALAAGCGGASNHLEAQLPAMQLTEPIQDHSPFSRDVTGAISEQDLVRALDSPVYLAEDTRLGIVPVAVAYEPDDVLPLTEVPAVLGEALQDTGFFLVTSEISTDGPRNRSISGLRELAARYRTRYLLLYRHRFVERQHTNGWGWGYITLIGIPFVPSQTLETAGVLEATMFDVRTGTILFTAYERVHASTTDNLFGNERELYEMRQGLLAEAADRLAEQVTDQVHWLVAARPSAVPNPNAVSQHQTSEPAYVWNDSGHPSH